MIEDRDQLDCRDDLPRRRRLREANGNGIDWVEVEPDGRTLTIAFIGPAPRLAVGNVRINGQPGDATLVAVDVHRCAEDDPEMDDCIQVLLDGPGFDDGYQICLVEADPDGRPSRRSLSGLDPRLACADLAFDVSCPADVDCTGQECPPETFEEPEISYLGKDYASFRQLVFDRLALIMPDWTERHVPDTGVALVELLAYVGDGLSYEQDAVATEAYLDTARLRTSVRRHVRLIDYPMHDGVNARAWVHIAVERPVELDPTLIRFITTPEAAKRTTPVELTGDGLRTLPAGTFETFEPVIRDRPARLRPSRNEIHLWTWGERECCMPVGATSATLRDSASDGTGADEAGGGRDGGRGTSADAGRASTRSTVRGTRRAAARGPDRVLGLEPGDILIFEEILGATTGAPADADPTHRQAVRLTSVTPGFDGAYGMPVLEVAWAPEDALTFPLCITAVVGEDCRTETVSVGRGNVILVDHGRPIDECDQPPEILCVPCPDLGPALCEDVPCAHGMAPGEREARPVRFRPVLAQSPVTIAEPFPAPERVAAGQASLLSSLPERVDRRLRAIWTASHDAGSLTDGEREELRTIFGGRAMADAGLGEDGSSDIDPVAAVGWLLGRMERLLDRKLRRLASLGRRARSGDRLGPNETAEIAASWGAAYSAGLDGERSAAWGSARAALEQDPRRALPLIRIVPDGAADDDGWTPRRDLLGSGPTERHVVAEMDDESRTHLRFGDGPLGRPPDGGQRLEAHYRVGNGTQGNVPAGAITRLVRCSGNPVGIIRITNPMPAVGGQVPEPVAEVKLMAPAAIRRSERAVTAADYAELARRTAGVQRAAATLAWTGSWYEARVGLDALGGREAAAELIAEVDASLHRYRRIGHDVRVGQARRVSVDLGLRVCVLPTFDRGGVQRAILDALGTGTLTDGGQGFFDPDRLTFGTDIHASAIVGLVQEIPGVESVTITALQRQFEEPADELEKGVLDLDALEVAQLDRTASTASGRLRLELRGGR
jgi:predicted phage baseplate assembly protein